MYNRKQRRDMERQLGLMKAYSQMSDKQKAEVRKRRMETGKQIHLQNVQKVEQYFEEQETLRYQRRIAFIQELNKCTPEEATAIVDEEYRKENEKFEKRMAKKMKSA